MICSVSITIAAAATEANPFPPTQEIVIPGCDGTTCPAQFTVSDLQSNNR